MAKLSKQELMALDLAIQVLRDSQSGIEADPAAVIGGILNVTRKVVNVTKKATPVVRVTVHVTPAVVGARAASGALMTTAESEEEFGQLSVDSLIALRNALGSDNE